jgi:hypothetical protein
VVDVEKLKALKALLDDGTLTQAEFDAAKSKLLNASQEESLPVPPKDAGAEIESIDYKEEGDSGSQDGQPEMSAGALFAVIGSFALALGLLLLIYRLFVTVTILYLGSIISDCCCFGIVDADDITGGFSGGWKMAGKAFSESDGDTFAQLIYFGASDGVTAFAWLALIGAVVAMVIGSILSSSKGRSD